MNSPVVANEHIEVRDAPLGRRAYIVGTRISVADVYVAHELNRCTPDEMTNAWPHVTLAQIHAALSYFYDHADEIRAQVKAGREFAEAFERRHGPGPLAEKPRP